MIDTKELRRLAQAAISKMNARDPEFASSVTPLAVLELLDRLEAVEKERDSYKFAFSEYSEKTEWVQQGINDGTVSAKYLCWHRADVMSDLLRAAEKERDALRVELETERVRLAACGVVALANTPDSAKRARDMRSEYWSASCGDVARLVEENIKLRAKIEAMEQQEPVGKFVQHPSNGLWEQDGYGDNPDANPLYALPGAKGE